MVKRRERGERGTHFKSVELERFIDREGFLRRLRPSLRYGLTAVMVLAFSLLRYAFGMELRAGTFLLFFPAIILASMIFDRGSGLLAVALSAVLAWYFLLEPNHSFGLPGRDEFFLLVLFVIVALFTALTIETLRSVTTKLKDTHDALRSTELELRSKIALLDGITETLPDPLFVKDRTGHYTHVNAALARVFGTEKRFIIGRMDRDFMSSKEAEAIESADQDVMRSRRSCLLEQYVTPHQERIPHTYLSSRAPLLSPAGDVVGIVGIAKDIQERKLMEDELRAALHLNKALLFDLNHRVKNHLQSLSGLLMMSRQDVQDARAQNILSTAAGRLTVLARAYDHLQLHEQHTSVRAVSFLESLCEALKHSLVGDRPVALVTSIDSNIELDSHRAVALGLIVNELVTNALKHAFPNQRAGSVTVRFHMSSGEYCLEIADDGVGGEAGKQGGGTRILSLLASQLEGRLIIDRGPPGTRISLCYGDPDGRSRM
jgi:PAS domain S-box-containing protein